MQIEGSTAFVTGANRGLGRHLAQQLVERGAKVYAGARDPASVDVPGAIPVAVDITDPAAVAAAAEQAGDVTLLINNAGIATATSLLDGSREDVHREFDVNLFGTLDVVRAFRPVLARNGGGYVLNVLTALTWFSVPTVGAYGAAKTASWSMTNAIRQELAPEGVVVGALHVGYMDTDMAAGFHDVTKEDPAEVARLALDGVEAGAHELLADDISRQVQAGLAGGVAALYPQLATA
jgi:NAD(P)-dependent dehydrogenase (short-subunit alcohol dehydrogenase family)